MQSHKNRWQEDLFVAGSLRDLVPEGQANEGKQLLEQVERIETTVGTHVACATCDAGYAHGTNYAAHGHDGAKKYHAAKNARTMYTHHL